MDEVITKSNGADEPSMGEASSNAEASVDTAQSDVARLRRMPTHIVFVEAPDDAGKLLRVGAIFEHTNGRTGSVRLDKNENARQLIYEHGSELFYLPNNRRLELAAKLESQALASDAHDSFDQAAKPSAPAPSGPLNAPAP